MNHTTRHRVGAWTARAVLSAFCGLAAPAVPALAQDAAHQQFLFAYKLMQRGDDAEAAAEFDDYLRRFDTAKMTGDAAYYRALLLRRGGAVAEASALLERDWPATTLVPGYAVDLLRGQLFVDLQQPARAVEALERVGPDTLEPTVAASVWYLRGLAYRGAGNGAAAEAALTRAAETAQGTLATRARLDLARTQTAAGKADAARQTLHAALRSADPTLAAEAARLAGDLAYEQGDYADAVAFYDRVVTTAQASPHYAAAAAGKLWALFAAQRYEEVLTADRALRDTLPDDGRVAAAYLAGSSLQELGRHADAVTTLEAAAGTAGESPLLPRVLYRLAVSYQALKRDDEVARITQRLERQFPGHPLAADAAFLRATSVVRTQGAEAGAAELTRLIEQGPSSPAYRPALRRRARLYADRGLTEAALADFRDYLATGAFDADATLAYAELLARAGRTDEALELTRTTLGRELPPAQRQEALFRLGSIQTVQRRHADAIATFERLEREAPLGAFAGEAMLKRAALLVRTDRPADATAVLIAAADRQGLPLSQRVLALRTLSELYRTAGRADDAALPLGRALSLLEAAEPGARLEADSLWADELLWLARRQLEQNQPDAALSLLARVEQPPRAASLTGVQRAERLYLTGEAHRVADRPAPAAESFQRVLALGEGFDLDARLGLARVAVAQGRLDEAVDELNELAGVEESSIAVSAMYELGRAQRLRAGRFAQAGDTVNAENALAAGRRVLKRMTLLYLDVEALQPVPQRGLAELAELERQAGDETAEAEAWRTLAERDGQRGYGRLAQAALLALEQRRADDALAILRTLDTTADADLAQRVADLTARLTAGRP